MEVQEGRATFLWPVVVKVHFALSSCLAGPVIKQKNHFPAREAHITLPARASSLPPASPTEVSKGQYQDLHLFLRAFCPPGHSENSGYLLLWASGSPVPATALSISYSWHLLDTRFTCLKVTDEKRTMWHPIYGTRVTQQCYHFSQNSEIEHSGIPQIS